MTDRLKGLTVVLDRDVRTDDAEALIQAILQLKGVVEVLPVIATPDSFIDRIRTEIELQTEVLEVFERRRAKRQ